MLKSLHALRSTVLRWKSDQLQLNHQRLVRKKRSGLRPEADQHSLLSCDAESYKEQREPLISQTFLTPGYESRLWP